MLKHTLLGALMFSAQALADPTVVVTGAARAAQCEWALDTIDWLDPLVLNPLASHFSGADQVMVGTPGELVGLLELHTPKAVFLAFRDARKAIIASDRPGLGASLDRSGDFLIALGIGDTVQLKHPGEKRTGNYFFTPLNYFPMPLMEASLEERASGMARASQLVPGDFSPELHGLVSFSFLTLAIPQAVAGEATNDVAVSWVAQWARFSAMLEWMRIVSARAKQGT